MTKEEKKTVYQAVILLEVLRKETKKDYLKNLNMNISGHG